MIKSWLTRIIISKSNIFWDVGLKIAPLFVGLMNHLLKFTVLLGELLWKWNCIDGYNTANLMMTTTSTTMMMMMMTTTSTTMMMMMMTTTSTTMMMMMMTTTSSMMMMMMTMKNIHWINYFIKIKAEVKIQRFWNCWNCCWQLNKRLPSTKVMSVTSKLLL